jgi:hypothetical protein
MTSHADEIRRGFANLPTASRVPLASTGEYVSWVHRSPLGYGVAVPLPGEVEFYEEFASAKLYSTTRLADAGGEQISLLRLECNSEPLRNQFALICAEFVDPGADGRRRAALVANPEEWWARWRELLGNVVREQNPYAVLAELLTYEHLLASGEAVLWGGPDAASHDVEGATASYEVKATITRYSSAVHIAGEHQLTPTGKKPLFLVHWRFEPGSGSQSIDSLMERLRKAGHDVGPIEAALENLGLRPGTIGRAKTYNILESRRFRVDARFPRITPASFAGGVMPAAVHSIEYQVDLSGLEAEAFLPPTPT